MRCVCVMHTWGPPNLTMAKREEKKKDRPCWGRYINNLGDGIKSRVYLFVDDTVLYSAIRTPTDSTNYRTTSAHWSPRKEVANVLWGREMSSPDCDREKEQNPHQLHRQQQNPWESRQRKVPWSRVDREPPLGETHPVSCCKSQQSDPPLHIATWRDVHLLSRHIATKALCVQYQSMHLCCGTSIRIPDWRWWTTVSPLQPSWLQSPSPVPLPWGLCFS